MIVDAQFEPGKRLALGAYHLARAGIPRIRSFNLESNLRNQAGSLPDLSPAAAKRTS